MLECNARETGVIPMNVFEPVLDTQGPLIDELRENVEPMVGIPGSISLVRGGENDGRRTR